MEDYRKMAEANQRRGREIIAETQLVESWEAIGAQANLIGSLSTGLMMKKLDIDMHVYTDTLSIKESFRAAARIASHPGIVRMEYTNLIDTEEECIEWHAAYRDRDGRMWKMDMIHIRRGSAYDGFAERMASRIGAVLTEETRDAILRLKYETPDTESIIGAEYYAAVLSGGVRIMPASRPGARRTAATASSAGCPDGPPLRDGEHPRTSGPAAPAPGKRHCLSL